SRSVKKRWISAGRAAALIGPPPRRWLRAPSPDRAVPAPLPDTRTYWRDRYGPDRSSTGSSRGTGPCLPDTSRSSSAPRRCGEGRGCVVPGHVGSIVDPPESHPEVRLSREAKAPARQWLSPDSYISLLKQSGFSSVDATEEKIAMPLDSLIDLGHYWLFIEGALPGVPLAIGAEALGSTVYDAAQELNMTYLPRMWLQIVATKGS
ncbi:MAG TPA: hypothetical protein VIY29_00745, partial [Ktedonobacteraceae bacterium]